uniref:Uncharacterized protein n=1 Tax=Oryza brachyantha TaxID=4533 RepID=J3MKC5_ORYBR
KPGIRVSINLGILPNLNAYCFLLELGSCLGGVNFGQSQLHVSTTVVRPFLWNHPTHVLHQHGKLIIGE